MGTYRINTIIAVVGTVALLPVAMLPILGRVTRRYGALRGWPLIAGIGLLGSAVALAAFTVFPLPNPGTLECSSGTLSAYWQTEWFGSIALIGDAWASVGFPAVLASTAFLQVLFNVVLFVPYGFFLHQVTRWNGLSVVLAGLATSALIEVTQGTGVFGLYECPYRVLDVDDLMLNTLGAAVGVLLSLAVARRAWANPAPSADLDAPSLARRVIAAGIDLGLIVVAATVTHAAWLRLADSEPLNDVILGLGAAALVVLAVPLMRKDRATPGQVVVNVAPSSTGRVPDAAAGAPVPVRAVLIRAAARWLPIVVVPGGVLVVALAELVTALVRKDTRSLAGLAARTTTRTKPAIASGVTTVLPGGNMSGAVRKGDTVLKPTQPQSETVQRLVAHVRAQGVLWPAEPLGTDGAGNDVWRFIPGTVTHDEPNDNFSTEVVTDVARRLREWHDATLTFTRAPSDVWWWPGKFPAEVICHVDFAPYNHVFRDGRFVGAIDFDTCYPGPRLWDLAYTAYRYVPLTPPADAMARARRLARMDEFLEAYGAGDPALTYSPERLLGYVVPRLIAMADWCDGQDSEDRKRDGRMYRSHAEWIARGGLGEAVVVAVPDLTGGR